MIHIMSLGSKNSYGFSLIELMTTLVIVIILSTVGFPMYRNYVISAKMAEAINVVDILDKNQQKYFAENGTFISTQPNPAIVPGMQSPGTSAAFGTSTEWAALGSPVTPGAAVLFSYQTFAGQTQPNSTTSIENGILYAPTANMDLERTGLYNASIQNAPMKSYALHAKDFQFEFGFSFNACAADTDACFENCAGDKDCESSCDTCVAECGKDTDCQANCGKSDDEGNSQCVEACKGDKDCESQCAPDDEKPCTNHDECKAKFDTNQNGELDDEMEDEDKDGVWDIDCTEWCLAKANDDAGCAEQCDPKNNDGECEGATGDPDCFNDANHDETPDVENGGGEGGGEDAQGDSDEEGGDGDGESDGDDAGGSNSCASFGVSTPVDFGIQADVANHAWYITSSVANFIEGNDCTLVVKVVNIINGQNSGGGLIQIRE